MSSITQLMCIATIFHLFFFLCPFDNASSQKKISKENSLQTFIVKSVSLSTVHQKQLNNSLSALYKRFIAKLTLNLSIAMGKVKIKNSVTNFQPMPRPTEIIVGFLHPHAWRLHKKLHTLSRTSKNCIDLNLGENLCILTSFDFPGSGLNILTSFYFNF